MSGWEAMQQGAPDPFFAEQRATINPPFGIRIPTAVTAAEAEKLRGLARRTRVLAHEIVRTTACSFCGSQAGRRCTALRRNQPTWDPFSFRWLPPSASHRARIEAYWRAQPANRD